jgi:HPt (histidine-containing phosphotransfer) domain-containing protein
VPVPDADDAVVGPLLDAAMVAELRDLSGESLPEMLELYLEDAAAQVLVIVGALERGDPAPAAAAAHRLKGASLSVGAARVTTVAGELERRASSGDVSGAAALLYPLERAVMNTAAALRAELEGRPSGLPVA